MATRDELGRQLLTSMNAELGKAPSVNHRG
jgi:hypothetical protein